MSEEVPVLSREEGLAKIGELIKDIQMAMLTTITAAGTLHSRPMATHQGRFEGELLFLTPAHSGKVEEIQQDAEASLTYVDAKHAFLAVRGRASLSADRELIETLWNPSYKAWFPAGKDDPEIRVLKVKVEEAEYWDAPSSAIVRSAKILARAVSGGKTKVGEHARVAL
ncbi:MAG TPA: pyridoxamine 5'-phosphate oxidase family protein [Acidobacteriaceae bacterium]